jgi:hypothetical protein
MAQIKDEAMTLDGYVILVAMAAQWGMTPNAELTGAEPAFSAERPC